MSKRVGRGIVGIAFVAAVFFVGIVLPRIGASGTIHDAASLPGRIHVCGRDWNKGGPQPLRSLAEIRVRDGAEPDVVDPGLFAPCPMKPCVQGAQNCAFDTVIYVRVGEDAYLDYELVGGP